MKQIHHYSKPPHLPPTREELAVFTLVITLAALVLGMLFLTGCAGSGMTQAVPTAGGRLLVQRPPPQTEMNPVAAASEILQFTQGENANSPSTIETGPHGELRVLFGTVEKPILTLPAAPDYTPYWCLVAGIVFLGAGIALFCQGWPQIGVRLFLAGLGMVILALTVKSYGWAYVLGLGLVAAWIAWEKFHSYQAGAGEAVPQPKQA